MKQIASTSLKNLTQFYYREQNDYGLDAEENETNDEEDLSEFAILLLDHITFRKLHCRTAIM